MRAGRRCRPLILCSVPYPKVPVRERMVTAARTDKAAEAAEAVDNSPERKTVRAGRSKRAL